MNKQQKIQLIQLSNDIRIKAQLPKNSKMYKNLMYIADACVLLSNDDSDNATKLIELVNGKDINNNELDTALLKLFKILMIGE